MILLIIYTFYLEESKFFIISLIRCSIKLHFWLLWLRRLSNGGWLTLWLKRRGQAFTVS